MIPAAIDRAFPCRQPFVVASPKRPDEAMRCGICAPCLAVARMKPISTAPRDCEIIGYYADAARIVVRFSESRACMLATTAPGAGACGEGFVDVVNGLPVDAPLLWEPID